MPEPGRPVQASHPSLPAQESLPPVLIVSLSIRHGGVDVRIAQTAQELKRQGRAFQVVVIAGTRLHKTLADLGLPIAALTRSRMDPRIVIDLVRLIRRGRVGLVDAHNTQSQYWAALAVFMTGVRKRIATVHSIYREDHEGRLRQALHEGALRLCKRLGFRFITVSSNVERYLVEDFAIERPRVLLSRNGMEDLATAPVAFDLAAETGWPTDTLLLAIIGRLDPRKGHRFALAALDELVRKGETRARLLIVGTGRDDQAIRSLVEDLGLGAYVHFAGFRDDVTSILTRVDVLLLPSTSEGLPYSVIEAARQAVPVLASRLEGTDDIFVDGETILFSSVGDAGDIARQIDFVLKNPDRRARIGAAARQLFLDHLQVSRMLDETLAFYAKP